MGTQGKTEDEARAGDAAAILAGAGELGVELEASTADLLVDHLDRVYTWNSRMRLTAVDRRDAVRLHILDSLSLIPLLPTAGRLADLGTGAGFPGLVLAAALPGLEITLVESKRKRCAYLTETIGALGLGNVRVVEGDATRLRPEHAAYFDVVTSRAFITPPRFFQVAARLLRADGVAVVMAGGRPGDLGLGDSVEIVRELALVLPGGDEARRILALRAKPTGPE